MSHPYYDKPIEIIKQHREQVSSSERNDPKYSGSGYDGLALCCALDEVQTWYKAYQTMKNLKSFLNNDIKDDD
jgi:hypothetical protein